MCDHHQVQFSAPAPVTLAYKAIATKFDRASKIRLAAVNDNTLMLPLQPPAHESLGNFQLDRACRALGGPVLFLF